MTVDRQREEEIESIKALWAQDRREISEVDIRHGGETVAFSFLSVLV